jgi:hypothetical protein
MTDAMPGKRYGALHAWQDGDSWYYLPDAASPQRDGNGRAQLTAIETGGMLMLTLGTSLTATEDQLQEARAAIAAAAKPVAGEVRLRPANAMPRGAKLTFTPDGGETIELARAQPSALAPHSAAFSAMLRGDQASAVSAAMKGGTGRLGVVYDMEIAATRSATARLEGDPGDAPDLDAALEAGALTLSLDADADASESLKAEARKRVIEEAVRLLAALPQPAGKRPQSVFGCEDKTEHLRDASPDQPDTTTHTSSRVIDAHVTRTEPAPRAVQVSANVADWL